MSEHKRNITINIAESQTIVELSTLLQKYQSEVYLINQTEGNVQEVNVKSLLGLVTLHLQNGDTVTVRAVGEDAEEAAQEVIDFFTK
ncbi:HPr family phosphocarrier protein [Salibacterium qingdaonense]|nr:HPr family phosphocarrier protein [Salibacterium qingdaonense]